MTVEEAVERILAGNPFIQCRPCLGTGKVGSVLSGWSLCKNCHGMASIDDDVYLQACITLGRPLPKNSLGLFTRTRNYIEIQKLRPDTLQLSLEDMNDVMGWTEGL